ncbi:uncharacterized protein BXZ73DRAFT_109735 [Epithele typhae]|uniref:uncharacterized protein n=1 Tax=Epithele typhae TaxID=378194 RepID=UPI0020084E9C|nr:uncharacterized protein BXZ73DRAFT_109735 [Epithele typhae]KAH9908829.1 hypothetical protein BXZ73DRAFT_109735 [Epithele typhae]
MASFVLDGNFTAQHRHMKNPENDVQFADGQIFTVGQGPFEAHLAREGKLPAMAQKSTCNAHRAVLGANKKKANLETTGIGAAACSRHGFFLPHTCVDFQRGEAQANMDYSFFYALSAFPGLMIFLVLYDIACQYWVNLRKRFSRRRDYMKLPDDAKFLYGIGQFHVHGHRQECYSRFSPAFVSGAGIQDGEILETLWASLNKISDSTRGMATSHRKEMIDDHMWYSNWVKLTRMDISLGARWKRVTEELGPAEMALDSIAEKASPDDIAAWESEAKNADEIRSQNPNSMRLYQMDVKDLPTRDQIQKAIMEAERAERGAGQGEASWLRSGLDIQREQLSVAYTARTLQPDPSGKAELALENQRQKLLESIRVFNKKAANFLPISAVMLDYDTDNLGDLLLGEEWDDDANASHGGAFDKSAVIGLPEHATLMLPSTLGSEWLERYELQSLAKKERELRKAEMDDALHAIKVGVGYKSHLYFAKARAAFLELLALEPDRKTRKKASAPYKTIFPSDLQVNTALAEPFTHGLRDWHTSWIWTFGEVSPAWEKNRRWTLP